MIGNAEMPWPSRRTACPRYGGRGLCREGFEPTARRPVRRAPYREGMRGGDAGSAWAAAPPGDARRSSSSIIVMPTPRPTNETAGSPRPQQQRAGLCRRPGWPPAHREGRYSSWSQGRPAGRARERTGTGRSSERTTRSLACLPAAGWAVWPRGEADGRACWCGWVGVEASAGQNVAGG